MTSPKPSLSIIIPALNEEKSIGNLLKDLSNQTFKDFEVIIVDGKSEDKTTTKAKSFTAKLSSLKIITSNKRNVSHQRNLGAKNARSDWLLFMDADNRLPPYFLQGIKYRIEVNQPDYFSTYMSPDSHSQKDAVIINALNLYLDLYKNTNNAGAMESMCGIRKSLFIQLDGFDQSIAWGEGADLSKRALKKNAKFNIFKDPKYTYSLRRLRNQNTLNFAANLAQLELSRILGIPVKGARGEKLYPMKGGKYFESQSKTPSNIERMLLELSKVKSLPQETKKIIKAKTHLPDSLRPLLNLIDPSTKNDSS